MKSDRMSCLWFTKHKYERENNSRPRRSVSSKQYYHVHIEADTESSMNGVRKINVLDLISSDIKQPNP